MTKHEDSPFSGGSVGQPAAVEKEPANYQHLKLLQEMHKLEIAKLKLQLELAMLGSKTALTGTQDASAKSRRSSSSAKDAVSTTLAAHLRSR